MQMVPPQNELVSKMPSDDVRGSSRSEAARIDPAPINCACSPRPYFSRASGGTGPSIFCDPVKMGVVGQTLEQILDVGEGVDAMAMAGTGHAE
jgi:hypothetical protein